MDTNSPERLLDPRVWLSASEVARRLGLAPSTISSWAKRRWLYGAVEVTGEKFFRLEDAKAMIEKRGLMRNKFPQED